MMNRPRILFIDAYDSFSNNIVSLLATVLNADVDILPIDPPHLDPTHADFGRQLSTELRRYDAVVCGPGPGAPGSARDVGLMKYIWDLKAADLIPVLGICLGFQSLVVSCGGIVKKLKTGLHGMIREIDHAAETPGLHEGNIFHGVPPFKATLYHSLHADIGQESISAEEWLQSRWASPPHLPNVVPLAWVYEDRGDHTERILMGVKHGTKPFWGLQYHPESICTESQGHQVIENWFDEAMRWNRANGRTTDPSLAPSAFTTTLPKLSAHITEEAPDGAKYDCNDCRSWVYGNSQLASFGLNRCYESTVLDLPIHVEVPDIVEALQTGKTEFIVLDSASAKASRIGLDVRGRYSIIALDVDEALKLEYKTGDRHATARRSCSQASTQDVPEQARLGPGQTIWQLLAEFWARRKVTSDDDAPPPFIGGFMGYTTYELGLEGINVRLHDDRGYSRPDLCFAWVTKSIVVDHMEGTLRIQYLAPSASAGRHWLSGIAETLSTSAIWSEGLRADFGKRCQPAAITQLTTPPATPKTGPTQARIRVPDAAEYEAKVRRCQDRIAAGDSYELCLTDQTHITRLRSVLDPVFTATPPPSLSHPPTSSSPAQPNPAKDGGGGGGETAWQLYRALRARQPAPFGSYVRLGAATLASSSPERFLTFTSGGRCSMRPMKGTVRKTDGVSTLAQAEALLHVPKEEAENLMIVDLVRHDLHGVCGAGRVSVPRLNVVEEYASVFQMVSVVEGLLPQLPQPPPPSSPSASRSQARHPDDAQAQASSKPSRTYRPLTGLDVLAASLPPGSMTGAPKKRSCELLGAIEGPGQERSLYSGVVGYVDATGRGDWSVTIRSLFRWDDEVVVSVEQQQQQQEKVLEVWHIGAGGAVTALSTPEGERDEMFIKLKGPLGIFDEM
ncbi:para-aminobenzoate synthase [Xylariaceae sp. FL0662B]|nr:para-aminobenzoate synthase [Xylariaceae sp. FL0662B]